MSFNPVVTPSMVATLKISSMCLESYPCQHKCTITLSDGREKSVTLGGPSINSLIQAVASEKISCKDDKSHFDYPSFEKGSAESILSSFFK